MKLLLFAFFNLLQINSNLSKLLVELQQEKNLEKSIVSVSISNLETKKSVFNYNSEKYISPASTIKLLSTATALSILGSNYRYETTLSYSGYIQNNTLFGNLIIDGNGDPSFGSPRNSKNYYSILEVWINKLKSLKINTIEGKIIIPQSNTNRFDIPDDWLWGDIGNYYGAIPLQFNFNENKVSYYLSSGKSVGDSVKIQKVFPEINQSIILNQLKTGPAYIGDQSIIYQSPLSENVLIKGLIPASRNNFEIKSSNYYPEKNFSKILEKALIDSGINVLNKELITNNKFILDISYSDLLKNLVKDCNNHSINLYAEAFLKSCFPNNHENKSYSKNIENLKAHWKYKGIDLDNFILNDGSGLAYSNKISTKEMADFLSQISDEPYFQDFFSSIPKVGNEGTVQNIDKDKRTNGKIRAKSGSMKQVKSYAGYFSTNNNKDYSFMVAINNYDENKNDTVRKYLHKLLIELVEFKE
jgi:serine-type D-Ala-D-Ala carboxypeptidase/endopeptidase (penicillin-binding protein 4)